jgi:hypothetical protein
MARHQYALQLEVLESPMASKLATYAEDVVNRNWRNSIRQKMDLPLSETILFIKWIFKLKFIVDGSNFKHKTQSLARNF